MIEIHPARPGRDIDEANRLNREYLAWCVDQARDTLGEQLDFEELYAHSLGDQEAFLAESGRLLLATVDGEVAGIACLKKIRDDAGEIKRMYVRPRYRGRNLGELLVAELVEAAKTIGYAKVLLDSDPYMGRAHAIYRRLGFVETEPYPEAEMDGDEYARHMVFMELRLDRNESSP